MLRRQSPRPRCLLNEMQVTGIFRTPRGWAAMVEATPIKLSYVIYPGESFFDGQLVAIEEGRLVFRRDIVWARWPSRKECRNQTAARAESSRGDDCPSGSANAPATETAKPASAGKAITRFSASPLDCR